MKFKKLILSGFKSFADRTVFEFDDGISCVVGPNGCGKSNIVDAVKWVLGEQSAKSLRGSEMLDVIFNGSANRRPAGMAEVTLVFDNSEGLLQYNIDGESASNGEVSVTRRLYRSGQSEYLINKVICRLKDIREMFMDTGVGVDAYSLIEQGRVGAFLQASQEERRAIFDEAAGISKYKARKKEALRKVERVEQNLLRLTDILGEVEKRLRSIKYQAGKARNYQAYSERLKELKSLYFLAQYHTHSVQRNELQHKVDRCNDELAAIHAKIDQLEAARSGADVEAVDLERAARDIQSRIAAVGGQILTCQERAEMLTARVEELGQQIVATCSRCEELEAKLAAGREEISRRTTELEQIESQAVELARKNDAVRQEHTAGELAITHLRAKLEDEKAGTIDLLRRTAQLHNEINASGIRRENLSSQHQRLAERAEKISDQLSELVAERAKVAAKLDDVNEVIAAAQTKLEETKNTSRTLADSEHRLQSDLSAAREKRSALQSRSQALKEMQQRLEGVGQGVKRVLEACKKGGLPAVRGMLGEFLETDVQHASVVEAALAGADQHLLIDSFSELAAASRQVAEILGETGAVEFLCMDNLGTLSEDFNLLDCPQATARVMDYVRFEPQLAPIMWRLFGRTLVVRSLPDAAAAAAACPAGYRFVTPAGEVLEADGRVRLGAANRGTGIIARKSELTQLQTELTELDGRIAALEQQRQSARNELEHLDGVQQSLRTAIYEANTERVEAESRRSQLSAEISRLEHEKPLIAGDMENIKAGIEASVRAEHEAREKAAELEQRNAERQREIEKLDALIASAQQRQAELSEQMTQCQVSLAEAQARKVALRDAMNALNNQQEQWSCELSAGRSQIELNRQRRSEAEQAITKAHQEVDELYARQEQLNVESADIEESRRGLAARLEEIRNQLNEHRKLQEAASEKAGAAKIELGEIDVRIENIISRASDEMGMNLTELLAGYQHDDQRDWAAVENEIKELRDKIERLGNVNLDAIAEQDELEKRQEFLTKQLEDIRTSQNQLEELIRRINKESRERFAEAFEKIRTNFQDLFRKLFGGGRADILLSNPEDILESGIEIVARPPGKELRSLTLLSGGEKTMTALALLFSIFRSRPSPFCLLDEVDAALDEANNERFNRLIAEFVSESQFIIISHAKRTMSMANVLYGVTMQEPGVSKRISVRFEEIGEHSSEELQAVGA